MATVNFRIFSKKETAKLYVRLQEGTSIKTEVPTPITVFTKYWDPKNQIIKKGLDSQLTNTLNSKISKLKIDILDNFNLDYMQGQSIDNNWLKKTIDNLLNRPKYELDKKPQPHKIYYTDFCIWWLVNKAEKHKVSANKYLDNTVKSHYENLVAIVKEFENKTKTKIKLKEINSDLLDKFSEYLISEKKYSVSTCQRSITRFKFFCARVEEENIEINKNYKSKVFVANKNEDNDFKKPYFNKKEILKIYNLDLSHNEILSNVRDNLIIGLWTGLRISDFLKRLDTSNIEDGFIKIKTEKTKTWVIIPLHKQVSEILNKRAGFLPPKISDQKFNKHIKKIAQICDFDEVIYGAIQKIDEVTKQKRNVYGYYKRYELVTSHICRRSFATNLFGEIPNSDICALGGWKTEDMMLHYIQESKMDSAIQLKKHWENNNI